MEKEINLFFVKWWKKWFLEHEFSKIQKKRRKIMKKNFRHFYASASKNGEQFRHLARLNGDL